MGFSLKGLIKVAAPIVGGMIGGPQGAAIGGAISSGIGGSQSSKAAKNAAKAQQQSAQQAINLQREQFNQTSADLKPFREGGTVGMNQLTDFVTNPNTQASYLTNNPLFDVMTGKARDSLYANQAARGKLGSGSTVNMLMDRILGVGTDLINQQNNRLYNLATIGENAAARTGSASQAMSNSIGNLLTQQGDAKAAGIVGSNNAQSGMINDLASLAFDYFSRPKTIISGNPVDPGWHPADTAPMSSDIKRMLGLM